MEKWNISPVKYYLSVFTVAMEAEVYPDIIPVLLDCLCYRSRLRLRVGFRSLRRRKIVKPSLKFRHHRMKSHLVRFRAGVRGHYAQPKTKHVPVSVQIHSVATWARRWRGSRKVSVNSWPKCFFSLFFSTKPVFSPHPVVSVGELIAVGVEERRHVPVHGADSSEVAALGAADLGLGELEGGHQLVQEERGRGDRDPLPNNWTHF